MGGSGFRGREGVPHPLSGSMQSQGLEQQESSLEWRLPWAEFPCSWSSVRKPLGPGEEEAGERGADSGWQPFTAVGLVTVVLAVVVPITDEGRVCADAC